MRTMKNQPAQLLTALMFVCVLFINPVFSQLNEKDEIEQMIENSSNATSKELRNKASIEDAKLQKIADDLKALNKKAEKESERNRIYGDLVVMLQDNKRALTSKLNEVTVKLNDSTTYTEKLIETFIAQKISKETKESWRKIADKISEVPEAINKIQIDSVESTTYLDKGYSESQFKTLDKLQRECELLIKKIDETEKASGKIKIYLEKIQIQAEQLELDLKTMRESAAKKSALQQQLKAKEKSQK